MQIDTEGFELGDVVRDKVTGFEGTVIGITQWLTGCARANIQPRVNKEGVVPDSMSIDVLTLEMVTPGPKHAPVPEPPAARSIGGPAPEPGRRPTVRR